MIQLSTILSDELVIYVEEDNTLHFKIKAKPNSRKVKQGKITYKKVDYIVDYDNLRKVRVTHRSYVKR
ncbi:MAG: hypothetical protein KUG81_11140 [Gammaproteobacteria bacterium]|nr:hypothetical protein [Gammaproteobacteria bacterium]